MSWTSHDRVFGFVHGFTINRNNFFFGGNSNLNDRPYPTIVNRPTLHQVINNWNRSDTGVLLTFFILGIFLAKRVVATSMVESLVDNRVDFKRLHRVFTVFGLGFGLRNSSYRL